MRSLARVQIITSVLALSAIALVAVTRVSGASRSAAHPSPSTAATRQSEARQPEVVEAYATYYGWYDNTPPGCATAYSGCAGGTGTYQHPITFASDKHEFPVGTILYYPTIRRYVRMGDDCQECDEDWSGKGPNGGPRLHHIDIWIGGNGGTESAVINCEDALTKSMPNGSPMLTRFIASPPSDLPVSTEPLFSSRANHCSDRATASASYGRYENVKSGTCLEGPGDGAKSGTRAELGPCNASAADQIVFDGAFFVVGSLCLQTQSGDPGAPITFTTCDGNDRQQWEINPNGTISWIQYPKCIADVSGNVELASCTNAAADRWDFTSGWRTTRQG